MWWKQFVQSIYFSNNQYNPGISIYRILTHQTIPPYRSHESCKREEEKAQSGVKEIQSSPV